MSHIFVPEIQGRKLGWIFDGTKSPPRAHRDYFCLEFWGDFPLGVAAGTMLYRGQQLLVRQRGCICIRFLLADEPRTAFQLLVRSQHPPLLERVFPHPVGVQRTVSCWAKPNLLSLLAHAVQALQAHSPQHQLLRQISTLLLWLRVAVRGRHD